MIKIIKRKAPVRLPLALETRPTPVLGVKATVNEWIAERRRNQLDSDISSRETIAAWTATTAFLDTLTQEINEPGK